MQKSHREVILIGGLVKCSEAEEGGGWLIEGGLLHGNILSMDCSRPSSCETEHEHQASLAVSMLWVAEVPTMACVYHGADMKVARSKSCRGLSPMGGQASASLRLLLAVCKRMSPFRPLCKPVQA